MTETPVLIEHWEELMDCKSATHTIEVDTHYGCGWILENGERIHYLSTHAFYGSMFKASTELLQTCGFNVSLKSWG